MLFDDDDCGKGCCWYLFVAKDAAGNLWQMMLHLLWQRMLLVKWKESVPAQMLPRARRAQPTNPARGQPTSRANAQFDKNVGNPIGEPTFGLHVSPQRLRHVPGAKDSDLGGKVPCHLGKVALAAFPRAGPSSASAPPHGPCL